jgi:NADPH:quinone reductase-like Zn-dependent oxidoreductase
VLVRVHAASVHPGDQLLLEGVPYLVRLFFGLRRPKNPVPGRDVAGTVEAVGDEVTEFKPGDEVFGWSTKGVLAEYACAAEDHFVLKPGNITFEQASTVAVSATTALRALRDKGEVKPGDKVLIIGASGGIGTFAVQIAKSMGAEVTGVCSTRNVELVRSIGADHVIDYTQEDFMKGEVLYDLILDNASNLSLSEQRQALAPKGVLIPNNGRIGGRWFGGTGRIIRAHLTNLFVSQRLRPFMSTEKKAELLVLKDLIETGKMTPVIDRTFALSDSAEALNHIRDGHARGKTVITV